ncbi:auxin-responsive protein SAUR68-like [Salvia hispanica]|uniref:auxin-responsive protein SAUR68-like n=1 Tax=Salvia hispanica TaxID=49212 RepID=UPI0020098144|nr:auxin-responsive protein SAUR68-like [Salvia hispanica]
MMIKIDVARKWREIAALGRKRISYPEKIDRSAEVAEKGHFVVYASDGVRFSFPIGYLSCLIFRELLRMSEEEFGHPRNGPITLPCDSQVLRYVASLMEKNAAEEVGKAFLLSMADCRCSSPYYLQQQQQCQHILLACC